MSAIDQIKKAKDAVVQMVRVDADLNQKILLDLADRAEANIPAILTANQLDLDIMPKDDPRYDRLLLNAERIKSIANDLRNVAKMDSPIGEVLEQNKTNTGLHLQKIRVALGVVGVIYEARPNVTFDVFALCFRTGNVAILKGGTDAWNSNSAIAKLIHESLDKFNVSKEVMQLLPPDRSAANELMDAVGYVDVLIPRGSQSLIDSVRKNAKVPVIETGAGVVHTYFDETADFELGKKVIFNAKTRRVSICNALECLIIHNSRLDELSALIADMSNENVILEADEASYKVLKGNYPDNLLTKANDASFGKEHLDYRLSIKTVESLDQALDHISKYSTHHSEAIITKSQESRDRFFKEVDAAAVYLNTSTAFTDGAQFGLGAEIGISTQKLHARGPMALKELTSYKWLVQSDGMTRPK